MRYFTLKTSRCASAQTTSQSRNHPPADPASPLAQRLTKSKPTSAGQSRRKTSRRSRNAVHPIDLRDLETALDLLSDPVPPLTVPGNITASQELLVKPNSSFTVTISVLHALDLHNPCLIRSCPHPFLPLVQLNVDDATPVAFDAARHAKNHSSWANKARMTHRIEHDTVSQLQFLRVSVLSRCLRYPSVPALVVIGQTDDIPLSLEPSDLTLSQFYPVFRYQTLQNRLVKYFAGKIKLTISIVQNRPPVESTPSTQSELVKADETVSTPPNTSLANERRSVFPINFSDALQLKRKQLKAVIVPEVVNPALIKSEDDPNKTKELMEELVLRLNHLHVSVSNVHVQEPIGQGIHANVFRVRLENFTDDIAMKEFRYEGAVHGALPSFTVLKCFEQEVEMLLRVSSAPQAHDHVVRLLGVMLTPHPAIFTDFCSDGSLARCLCDRNLWSQVSVHTKLVLGLQIATGLARLHSVNVVHRDIKTHNIVMNGLLSSHPVAKIGDLGSAHVRLPMDPMLVEESGSSGYTAPEVFGSKGYDHSADIWSLGIVLWELLLHGGVHQLANPYLGICGDAVVQKAERGEHPIIPHDSLPPACEALLKQCWELDPSRRPSAMDISLELERIISNG